ncbi:HAD-like domain-containing protein [Dunaliella salina]|uniref:HAD-like domain-containing protein n=1 Tax=Dunaliella salina TaxID=3046 RepID=A0ABQ7GU97_DUNSA|nr:HAD-like domain-containing protein [Dunaliella salina]|eukprot:KAF5838196.1 HAD-like domain-containing protein [Dunaliella salina]
MDLHFLLEFQASGYQINYDDWHSKVHAPLDYQSMLHPDVLLREILCSIDLPKYILTNADTAHARKCLDRIGIRDCFEAVFDFEWAQSAGKEQGAISPETPLLCKPQPKIYELALKAINCKAEDVIFFDDSVRNVTSAHNELGMLTVLVGRDGPVPGADVCIPTFHQLPNALPSLFTPKNHQQQEQQHQEEKQQNSH